MRLIDAEKFLKEILTAGIGKTIIEYSESDIGYMIRRQPTVDAAELLRDRWISVDERLPETEEEVLVLTVSKTGNVYGFEVDRNFYNLAQEKMIAPVKCAELIREENVQIGDILGVRV